MMDPLGNLTVWSSTQGVFLPRQEIARALGLPEHRVKVVAPALGGGFGGKGILTQPLSAALAIKYGRPVRVIYTRMDELQAANPAPRMSVHLKIGAKKDGTLTALDARLVVSSGLYNGGPLANSTLYSGAFYRYPSLQIRGYTVVTNTMPAGAYRAPGGPQTMFSVESTMDDLARELGIDPIELRLKNASERGRPDAQRPPLAEDRPPRVPGAPAAITPPGRTARPAPTRASASPSAASSAASSRPARSAAWRPTAPCPIIVGSVDVSGTNTGLVLMAAEALGILAPPHPGRQRRHRLRPLRRQRRRQQDHPHRRHRRRPGRRRGQRARSSPIAADQLEVAAEDLEIADGQVQVAAPPSAASASTGSPSSARPTWASTRPSSARADPPSRSARPASPPTSPASASTRTPTSRR